MTGLDYGDKMDGAIPNEFHSEIFTAQGGDTIKVSRSWSVPGLSELQDSLSTGDEILWKLTLRREVDSSYICTIDSLFIKKTAYRGPNSVGGDTDYAVAQVPITWPNENVFVSLDITRSDTSTNLQRSMLSILDTTEEVEPAPKRANGTPPTGSLGIRVIPNPFNGSTTVDAEVIEGLPTTVEVYDVLGHKMATLYNSTPDGPQLHLDFSGAGLASGTYLIRVQSGNTVVAERVQLLR